MGDEMNAVVTGGGGFLGQRIVARLRHRGDAVTVVSRNRYPAVEAMGATSVSVDLTEDSEALVSLMDGVDVVFHVAALAGIWGKRETFFSINTEGTRRVIEACQRAGVPRLVYTGSPSATWSGENEAGCTEAECPYPETFLAHYPASKAAAEQLVLAANCPEFATTSLRPHLIWGPDDPHLLPRLLARGRQGRLRIVGEGKNQVGITFVDNAAHAHILAADALAPGSANAGKGYFITDDVPVVLWDWINEVFSRSGVAPVTKKISAARAEWAGGVLEWIWRMGHLSGEPPMTRFVARQLSTDHHYDLSAARQDFGYAQLVADDEAFEKLIDWIKAEGLGGA